MAVYIIPFAMSALLAVLYETKLLRLTRGFYGLALFVLALFAGLRFEVGQDWPAYKEFFDDLGDVSDSRFEIGYYWLNYAVKWLGGSYSTVFLIASLFCAYAVYRLTSRFKVNRFYILTIYISYSFLLLHFAQVRQSIAVAFFLLGVDYYLRRERKLGAILIASIGVLFQFSALMYVALMLAVFLWQWFARLNLYLKAAIVTAIIPVTLAATYLNFYAALSFLAANASAEERIAIYQATQETPGPELLIFGAYLAFMAWYIARYGRSFVSRYAVITLLATLALMFAFRGNYVMYSRCYIIACIFQALAAALILAERKGWLHRFVFMGSIGVGLIYYLRILSINADAYAPYRAVVGI
jgi:hypothetical protein